MGDMQETSAKAKGRKEPKASSVSEKKSMETDEKEKTAEKILVRVEWLANFWKVSVRRIQQLQQEGVIKPEPGGSKKEGAKYDCFQSLRSMGLYYKEKADFRRSGDSEEMKKSKERQAAAKAKLEELKLAQLEGDLHKAEDIERVIGALLTRLRINLLAIPMGLAPTLRGMDDAMEIAEKLDERIRRAMNEAVEANLKELIEEEYSGQES
jgi:phage terminase Nu1 subunit (DNA packaging protein)